MFSSGEDTHLDSENHSFPYLASEAKKAVKRIRAFGSSDKNAEIPLKSIALLGIYSYHNKRVVYNIKAADAMVLALSRLVKLPIDPKTDGPSRPTYDLEDTDHTEDEEKAVCGMIAALADMAIEDENCGDIAVDHFNFLIKFLFRTANNKYRTLLLKIFGEFIWSIKGRSMMRGYRLCEFVFEHGLSDQTVDVWLAEIDRRTGYNLVMVPCSPIAMAAKGLDCFLRMEPHRTKMIYLGIRERLERLQAVVKDERAKAHLRHLVSMAFTWKPHCREADYCYYCKQSDDGGSRMRLLLLLRCSDCRVAGYCSSVCQKADWNAGHKEDCKKALSLTTTTKCLW
eukprot:TRINITY_DN1670_c0_g1_i2.p1 TRINITY_DN1670_c0_g1~~TRINITY_DN1670_c0_g1_i2.p1  ORF type:complete len:340 (-),score=61.17 TRINITY_DN1670_c0_g1_i2:114-1133(-)